jgi:hypothetical protein
MTQTLAAGSRSATAPRAQPGPPRPAPGGPGWPSRPVTGDHGAVTRPLDPAQRQRLRTPANLWRALLPLLVVVGVVALLNWPRSGSDGVHVIDIGGPVSSARQAGLDVLEPSGLSDRWRPTSTEFLPAGPARGASFRIGYVSPAGRYAELLQGNDAPEAVAAQYGPMSSDGTAPVNGASWSKFRTDAGRQLLRRTVGRITVIVTGSASQDELSQLAGSLH